MNFSKPNLNIGVIGSGFMGKTHVYGFAIADRVFDLPYKLNLISIADVNSKVANSAAKKLGFQKATTSQDEVFNDIENLKDRSVQKKSLFGIPLAVKDLIDVKGLPTTYGVPKYKNNVAKKK